LIGRSKNGTIMEKSGLVKCERTFIKLEVTFVE